MFENEDKEMRFFRRWFAFVAIVTGVVFGVGVWAVVKLVNHFTGG